MIWESSHWKTGDIAGASNAMPIKCSLKVQNELLYKCTWLSLFETFQHFLRFIIESVSATVNLGFTVWMAHAHGASAVGPTASKAPSRDV